MTEDILKNKPGGERILNEYARTKNWDQHSGHLDSIMESRPPYLLAVGTQRSVIHKHFIAIDKHAIPCKSPDCRSCIDELFKAHFVFGTSYNQDLVNVYNFLQTTIYEINVETTKLLSLLTASIFSSIILLFCSSSSLSAAILASSSSSRNWRN
ncbi:hypothetical protein F7725_016335 [Dissostichus mawsoni]|uniref:Uncharacterized protein n=1 Tax=Dissostichus mawsoni TaxID=36200 RepID=A0A7J5Z1B7_DISMA|nr:hypothetical protein F7725_016335 [Dissostichus mawsoni]